MLIIPVHYQVGGLYPWDILLPNCHTENIEAGKFVFLRLKISVVRLSKLAK